VIIHTPAFLVFGWESTANQEFGFFASALFNTHFSASPRKRGLRSRQSASNQYNIASHGLINVNPDLNYFKGLFHLLQVASSPHCARCWADRLRLFCAEPVIQSFSEILKWSGYSRVAKC
jgi:hypothetical protein